MTIMTVQTVLSLVLPTLVKGSLFTIIITLFSMLPHLLGWKIWSAKCGLFFTKSYRGWYSTLLKYAIILFNYFLKSAAIKKSDSSAWWISAQAFYNILLSLHFLTGEISQFTLTNCIKNSVKKNQFHFFFLEWWKAIKDILPHQRWHEKNSKIQKI